MTARLWVSALLAGVVVAGLVAFKMRRSESESIDPPPTPVDVKGGLLQAGEGDWPWWRGPMLDGTSADRRAVTKWGPQENVLWKTEVPGAGHASPIVCGSRVFLTSAEEKPQRQLVLAFDRKTGKQLWSTVAHEGGFPPKHHKNTHASATPACDGKRVYSAFINQDGLYVTATDLEGVVLWQTKAGTFQSEHGYGSSPVLYGSLVIVNGDNRKKCFIAGIDCETGKVAWRTERKTTGRHGSYGSPIVAKLGNRPQVILSGMGEVDSYDPKSGARLWSCDGPAEVTGCTVAAGEGLIFASGGFPEKEVLAIRADGDGDVTKTHMVWRSKEGVTYVPSPLYHDGRLYVVSDSGIASCFEAQTGKQVWQERLSGSFSSSLVLAGGLLYASSETGKTFVFKAGPEYQLVATNTLGEGIMATPAICGGRIFLRTEKHLFCLGKED